MSWPVSGARPWDDALKAYIDAGDAGGGGGSGLPAGFDDVTNSLVFGSNTLDDSGTVDNAVKWQNAVDLVAVGKPAVFVFPQKTVGDYAVGSTVNYGGRSIRNIGVGSSAEDSGLARTRIVPLADGITVLSANGGGTLAEQGPSFEQFCFGTNSHVNVTGLLITQVNRVHLRDVSFQNLLVGAKLDEGGKDCAYHHWESVNCYSCATGILSQASNSWTLDGYDMIKCAVGFDFVNANQVSVSQGKFDTPQSGTPIGIRLGNGGAAYANCFDKITWESGVWAGPATLAEIIGDGGATSTHGYGNRIHCTSLHAGEQAGNTDTPFVLNGAWNNVLDWDWASGQSVNPTVTYIGTCKYNRIRGGGFVGLDADLPVATKIWAGVTYIATDTHKFYVCDGTAWKLVATTT